MRHPPAAHRTSVLVLALTALGICACESGFDRNDQLVNSVRILGVRTQVESDDGVDWADAEAGDTVRLSALVTNPTGDPSLKVTWIACLPVSGQVSPCTYPATLRDPTDLIAMASDPSTGVLLLGTGSEIEYTIPTALAPLLDGLIAKVDPKDPNAPKHPNAECALYTQIPLIVIAQVDGQKPFAAAKNIRLSPWREIGPYSTDPTLQFYPRNANPTVQGLYYAPPDQTACAGQTLVVACLTDGDCATTGGTCTGGFCAPATWPGGPQVVCLDVGQPQSFYDCDLNGPVLDDPDDGPPHAEEPSVTWYMTAGALSDFSPPAGHESSVASRLFTGFTPQGGGRPFTLYGVVRDGRDGESWIAQDFQ